MGGKGTRVTFYIGTTEVDCDTSEFCGLNVGAEPPVVVIPYVDFPSWAPHKGLKDRTCLPLLKDFLDVVHMKKRTTPPPPPPQLIN